VTGAVRANPELMPLGLEVRRLRDARGWSQEELAERSGLHRNYIGGIERAERNVGVMALLRLAKALELRPGQLLDAYSGK